MRERCENRDPFLQNSLRRLLSLRVLCTHRHRSPAFVASILYDPVLHCCRRSSCTRNPTWSPALCASGSGRLDSRSHTVLLCSKLGGKTKWHFNAAQDAPALCTKLEVLEICHRTNLEENLLHVQQLFLVKKINIQFPKFQYIFDNFFVY